MNVPQEVRRWARSLPSVATAMKLVADNYAAQPADATLVRSFMNDVYRIDTASRSYALKVYGAKRFSADEVRWEQQLDRHFARAGLPVAGNVALCGGDSVGTLEAPEGERLFALTEWVPGNKPEPPWSDSLYRTVGRTLAQLHASPTPSVVTTREMPCVQVTNHSGLSRYLTDLTAGSNWCGDLPLQPSAHSTDLRIRACVGA